MGAKTKKKKAKTIKVKDGKGKTHTVKEGSAADKKYAAERKEAKSSSSSSSSSSGSKVTYNTNTGAKLKPGESFVDKATGKTFREGDSFDASSYVSSAKSSAPSTSTSAPSLGSLFTASNLKIGSSGDQVKQLQNYLKGIGIYDGKVDGVFGPLTNQAVKQLQASNGLKADGIVGPKTRAALEALQTGKPVPKEPKKEDLMPGEQPEDEEPFPYDTGNPADNAALQEIWNFIQTQQEAGLKLNPDLEIDEATLTKFLETAKKQVKPYFQQMIDVMKKKVEREAPQILGDYERRIQDEAQGFESTLGSTREGFAQEGLAFSGGRAKQEIGMKEATDRNLKALSESYGSQLGQLGREAEEQLGTENLNLPFDNLNLYSASISGKGGINKSGTAQKYQSGGYKIGKIKRDEEAAIESRNQALRNTAAENIRQGRSYQDLFA